MIQIVFAIVCSLLSLSAGAFRPAVGLYDATEYAVPAGVLDSEATGKLRAEIAEMDEAIVIQGGIYGSILIKDYDRLTKRIETLIIDQERAAATAILASNRFAGSIGDSSLGIDFSKDGFGSERTSINSLTRAFLNDVERKDIADIGCGTGFNVFQAHKAGARSILAVDLLPQNLRFLLKRFLNWSREKRSYQFKDMGALSIGLGKFPAQIELPENAFDSILISHVVHYLDPHELRQTLLSVAKALRPGGRVYIQALTIHADPYNGLDKGKFPQLDQAPTSVEWPFLIKQQGITQIHPQDFKTLKRELERVGLTPTQGGYFSLNADLPLVPANEVKPIGNHYRENDVVAVVAQKAH